MGGPRALAAVASRVVELEPAARGDWCARGDSTDHDGGDGSSSNVSGGDNMDRLGYIWPPRVFPFHVCCVKTDWLCECLLLNEKARKKEGIPKRKRAMNQKPRVRSLNSR
jgi:hypothetical protein